MNKLTVLKANKLYAALDEVNNQISKLEKEEEQKFLITIHLSVALHIDNVPKEFVLGALYKQQLKITNELLELGCEI